MHRKYGIEGSHRCSLTGHDLNRVWDSPSRSLHPEIYHSKAIIQNLVGYQRNGFVQKSNKAFFIEICANLL